MCAADVESGLFRDCSRGLEGGAFNTATLLHRTKAKLCKGKDAIDHLKDFISIKGEAMFDQYFLKKYNLDPLVDNTPSLLKTAPAAEKEAFLYSKVQDALKDLLPEFKDCTGIPPNMDDFPLRQKATPCQSTTEQLQQASVSSRSLSAQNISSVFTWSRIRSRAN